MHTLIFPNLHAADIAGIVIHRVVAEADVNDNNNADDNDKGKMIDENGPSDGDRILLIIQVKYFFISFKGKRMCQT